MVSDISEIGQHSMLVQTYQNLFCPRTQVTAAFRFIFNEMSKYCKFSNKRLPYRLTV